MAKSRSIGLLVIIALLVAVGWGPSSLRAQQYFSAIAGTVYDPTKSVVPDATVTVTNTQTQLSRQVKTDTDGNYVVGSLVPGPYSVKVEHTGFRTVAVPTFDLHVSRTVTIDVTMELGTVSQVVTVQTTTPLLDTTDSTVGTVINNDYILAMPLNGRDFTSLIGLVPGSVASVNRDMVAGGTDYSLSGNRYEQNNYSLDGVPNNESFFMEWGIQPSIDVIQEFKAQTNVTSAEFGQAAGGNIAVATKSGTNHLHGDLYEFVRNDVFDAATFFGNYDRLPKSAYKQNQFGGTVGGPIYIPHLYNGRDKAFWFFNYEDWRLRQASSVVGTIPTTTELQGNLTGQPAVYDPATTVQIGTAANGSPIYSSQQIQCNGVLNVICPSRISPAVAAFNSQWYPAVTTAGANNFINGAPEATNQWQYNTRVDYKIRDNVQFFGRVTEQSAGESTQTAIPNDASILSNLFFNGEASLTWLVSPTTVVDFKSAYDRDAILTLYPYPAANLAYYQQYPIQGMPLFNARFPQENPMLITGYTEPQQGGNPFIENTWNQLGSLSMMRGKHFIKLGLEIDHMNGTTSQLNDGNWTFTSVPTENPQSPTNTGSAIASDLLGLPSQGGRNVGEPPAYMHQTTQAYYIQDDWKVTPRFTVDLGLRWEYDQWPFDKYGHLGTFDVHSDEFVWAGINPITGQGPNIRKNILDPDYHDFAPRVGLAYQLTPKTIIRSGFGKFYASDYLWFAQAVRGQYPYGVSQSFAGTNIDLPTQPIATYFPAYDTPQPGTTATTVYVENKTDKTSYSMQWNLGVQQELARNLLLEVDYIGDGGRHLETFINGNDPMPGPGVVGSAQHPRPYEQYAPAQGPWLWNSLTALSDYNGLQVKVDKQFSNHLQFISSYTWAHYIDIDGGGYYLRVQPQNDYDVEADRADGAFDIRHNFSTGLVYELPAGQGRRFFNTGGLADKFVGGWEATSLLHCNTGAPANVTITFDNANVGQDSLSQRPDYLGGPQKVRPTTGDITKGWLNPSAYAVAPQYSFGNLGRDTVRNPGFVDWDLGTFKDFPFHREAYKFQFRAEFFNVLNHVNLGAINGQFGTSDFGVISSTQNNPRQIQLALKFIY